MIKLEAVKNNLKENKKMRIAVIAVVAAVVLLAAALLIYNSGLGPADKGNDEPITVNIPAGSGAVNIIDILDEKGLVKNPSIAKIHVRLGGYDSLQANTYIFSKDMGLKEILKAINTGDLNYVSKRQITIVEGFTVPQAAAAMAEKLPYSKEEIIGLWNNKDYLRKLIDKYWFLTDEILADGIMYPLEGYLYPETYIITDENATIEDITDLILSMTDEKLSERREDIEATGRTVHQFMSLTSVAESESLFDEDRPIIAGVFINRLEKNMPLQSDITVLYALQEKRVDVTYKDLEVESKYNTYKYTGLPVGPVCAVSAPAMDDVLSYKKTDYLFFFAKKDGTVIYSKTLDEHEKAIDENLWY